MQRLLTIAGVLLLLVAIAWLGGSLLPREHQATSRIALAQSPDTVWAVVRNLGALQGTWTDLAEARRVSDSAGREVWEEKVSWAATIAASTGT